MRRCPTCNQRFTEEWLSFCTNDGTPLLEEEVSQPGSRPTVLAPATPPSQAEQPTMNLPGSYVPPPVAYTPPPARPVWQPPPPPTYARQPSKNVATASMIVGLVGITVGWLCGGPLMGIAAVVLGIVALSQIKKSPQSNGGKEFAWIGIATGGLVLLVQACIFAIYIIALIASSH